MRVVHESIDLNSLTNSLLMTLESRRRSISGAHPTVVSASELRDRDASLVVLLTSNINLEAIKSGLRIKGYHGTKSAKLVKKAVNDIVNAILSAAEYSDSQRRAAMLRKRIETWCEKIDPLKRINPKKKLG